MIENIALILGYSVMAAGGMAIAGGLLWLNAYFLNKAGWRAWDRAKSLYKVEVLQYWFLKMDKDGTHAARKDYESKKTTPES